jgi:hypothetical protein
MKRKVCEYFSKWTTVEETLPRVSDEVHDTDLSSTC